MSILFKNDLVFMVVFGVAIFICTYLWIDKVLNFLYKRSLGTREEVMQLMDKMFVDADKEKVTWTMLLLSFGVGVIVFLLFWPNLWVGGVIGSIVTIVGWSLPKKVLLALLDRRNKKIVDQMVDAMTLMANGIKAGLSVQNTIDRVCENMNGPITQEFRLIQNKLRLGLSLEEAINEFGDRVPEPDVIMFVNSVSILNETGGNLAQTFNTIAFTIRERQKIFKKIDALTASSKMQARIITMVPFVILAIMMMFDPNSVMPLFTTTVGWVALVIMLALLAVGSVVMNKVVTIKV
ncbi:MAG: type II secretion system F family protein [Bdellovibrionales bacterium]